MAFLLAVEAAAAVRPERLGAADSPEEWLDVLDRGAVADLFAADLPDLVVLVLVTEGRSCAGSLLLLPPPA